MDSDLIELQAAVLFRYDKSGRMLCLNQADAAPAPRLFLGRTRAGNLWRFRHDLPDRLVRDLEQTLRAEPAPADLREPPQSLDVLIHLLQRYAPLGHIWTGPAWHFPDDLNDPNMAVRISRSNLAALEKHYPWAIDELEDMQPCTGVIVDSNVVSLCFCARISPHAAEAGIETVGEFRGRGYAVGAVTAWARAVREESRIPLYSTSWDNSASRAVANKLRLKPYGADLWIE